MENKKLVQKILNAANYISNAARKGSGDWITVSSSEGLKYLNKAIEDQKQREILKQRKLKIEHLKNKI
jgi:hypothetical protein